MSLTTVTLVSKPMSVACAFDIRVSMRADSFRILLVLAKIVRKRMIPWGGLPCFFCFQMLQYVAPVQCESTDARIYPDQVLSDTWVSLTNNPYYGDRDKTLSNGCC